MNNLVRIDNNQLKKIAIGILDDVFKFCDNNNIRVFLACGTLLGAIKYNGFIPWDDDVDVMMPRPDFIRFINTYKSEKYILLKPEQGMYLYGKVYDPKTIEKEKGMDYKKNKPIGINIDIFPLDGIVNDEEIVHKQQTNTSFYETLLRLSNQPIFYRKNKLKAINRIIPRIIGSKNIVRICEKICQKYNYDESDYVIRYKQTSNGINKPLPKEVYEPFKYVFEGKEYSVPKGYDIWLKSFYGDNYLTYTPGENERFLHDKESYIII